MREYEGSSANGQNVYRDLAIMSKNDDVNLEAGVQRGSGTMMRSDDIYKYQGITPIFAQNFNETVPWEGRTDTLISWFVHSIYTINFGILYNEEPDHHGHAT